MRGQIGPVQVFADIYMVVIVRVQRALSLEGGQV